MGEEGEISSLIKHLQNYELNDYVDILLLGPEFNQITIDRVDSLLQELVRADRSSQQYVRVTLKFHISLAKHLELNIANVSDSEFFRILEGYHFKSTSKTTIFLIDSPNRRTFGSSYISRSGFAFLDYRAICTSEAFIPGVPSTTCDQESSLATFLSRSFDQLIPGINLTPNKTFLSSTFVQVYQICGFPLGKCNPDGNLMSILEQLSTFSLEHQILHYSSQMIRLTESLLIRQAFFNSIGKYTSDNLNGSNPKIKRRISISPSQFVSFAQNSRDINNFRNGLSSPFLPIFCLSIPEEFDIEFASSTFSKNLSSLIASVDVNLKNVSLTALVILCPTKLSYNSIYSEIQSFLSISSTSIIRNANLESREIVDGVLQSLWGISPPTHPHNYIWSDSFKYSVDTFRDRRIVPRFSVVYFADSQLRRLAAILSHYSIFQVNVLIQPLVGEILQQFEQVANEYSHLEYASAYASVRIIEAQVSNFEMMLINFSTSRDNFLNCRLAEYTTNHESNIPQRMEVMRYFPVVVGVFLGFAVISLLFKVFISLGSKSTNRRIVR